ncbi:MAG: hypothetical protein K1060chlam4_00069 [Candidatus Anoxychlamydiales bacterium]|nr:hypothetical protein [Candidatus Anoxychlamydiales bacterium]
MSNVQIDTMQTSRVKTNFELEKLTSIALPEDQNDDASNNSKKSKQYLFNKVQTAAPKIESTYDINQMTTKELIALYGKLPSSEQNELIKQIFENNPNRLNDVYQNLPNSAKNKFVMQELKALSPIFTEMYNNSSEALKTQLSKEFLTQIASLLDSLPKDKKDEFASNFKKFLNKALKNDKNLSSSDKKDVKGFVNQINSYLVGKTKDLDLLNVKSGGILNIMMIMVKAFCDSMNTESLDMLSQIDQISTYNMYLDIAKTKLEKDGNKLAKLGDVKTKGWVFVLVSIAVFALVFLGSCFVGPEADASSVTAKGAEEVKGGSSVIDNEGENLSRTEEEEEDITSDDKVKDHEGLDSTPSKSKSVDLTSSPGQEVEELEGASGTGKTGGSSSSSSSSQLQENVTNRNGKVEDEKETQNAQTKKIEKTGEKGDESKLSKAFQPRKLWFKATKNTVMFGGFASLSLYGFLKGIKPELVNFSKNKPQQPDALALSETQNDSAIETTCTDTLNNSIQTSSTFINNDSQKQNTFSGDVQQAINMLGQAYTGQ